CGLAAAEVAGERDKIAGLERGGEITHRLQQRLFTRYRVCEDRLIQRQRLSLEHVQDNTWAGNSQITVVPRPTSESMRTVPPCSAMKDRTIDSPSPTPRCR